ncbi:MAG: ribosome maturation factor RimP [Candidatus Omnitrophota bacterium]|jgi:ribosome maturation factor RimP
MDNQETITRIRGVVEEYLKAQGLDLIDIILRREGKGLALSILADRPEGGITIGECARLNSGIGNMLDEKGLLEGSYTLEVSSPGLDRPLTQKSDFLRCINKRARFFLNEPVNGKIEVEGTISRVEGESVYITKGDEETGIPLAKINKAKQII